MAMHAGEIAKFAHVDLENFGTRAAERERTLDKCLGESIHHKSAAPPAVAAVQKFILFSRCCVEGKRIHERNSVHCFHEKMRCRIYRYICARVRWNGRNRNQRDERRCDYAPWNLTYIRSDRTRNDLHGWRYFRCTLEFSGQFGF